MTAGATGRSCLRIGRVNVTYLVPRDHPAPTTVRAQLDTLVTREVAGACARMFQPLCDEGDASVWFVRRLAVDILVDAGWKSERLADTWAAGITRSLSRRLSDAEVDGDVLHFSSRAAWLAQFLRDLADGAAWSKWYYAELEGLRPLPSNAALREAVCREPETGEAALAELAQAGRLERILRALSDADCGNIWHTFRRAAPTTDDSPPATDLLKRACQARQQMLALDGNHRAALQLYFFLRVGETSESESALRQAVALVGALGQWMHSAYGDRLIRALQQDDVAAAHTLLGSEGAEALVALRRYGRATLLEIAGEIRSHRDGAGACIAGPSSGPLATAFGGVFHLLPHLAELDLTNCADALPEFDGTAPLALVRFLVLLKCLGSANAPRAFFDPLLRQLTGTLPDLDARQLRGWVRKATRRQAAEFQDRWAADCRCRGSINQHLLSLQPLRRGKAMVLADCEQGRWLRLGSMQEMADALASWPTDELPEALLCAPALIPSLPGALPPRFAEIAINAWTSSTVSELATKDKALALCLERTRPPDEDLKFLNLARLLTGAQHLDLALTLPARAVLRSFGWRLPGFAWSSAEYLYANFLDISATAETQTDDWQVRLSEPALNIVLKMSGASHLSYHVPWLNQRIRVI